MQNDQRSPVPRRTRGPAASALIIGAVLLLAAGAGWWWWQHGARGSAAAAPSAASAAALGGPRTGGGGGAGPGGRRFGGANQTQPVSVDTVRRQDMHVTVAAIGSMEASNTAIVRAQVSGVLQSLNFKEGQQVRAGQLLAQIDPRAFQAAVGQAQGVLARDTAQLDGARVDLARYRDLLANDAIPKQQLDSQVALVGQLEGTVKSDQGTLANAQLQLSYTRVTAPIAGRVGLKQADLGNVVNPSDANGIVSIAQTRPVALVFAVPSVHVARLVPRLRSNDPVLVRATDRSGSQVLAEGRVTAVDNAIDASTDTIKVKALFPNADDTLFPNQAVSVSLQLQTQHDVLTVPGAAVLRGTQGFYVYVVNADSTVATRSVKPGTVDGARTAVEGTLQPGEQVVIDGTDRLREGAKVNVIAADPAQRAGASAPAGGRRRMHAAAAAGAASAASGASAASAVPAVPGGAAGSRLDPLPPEQAAALNARSPDARHAGFQARSEGGASRPAP